MFISSARFAGLASLLLIFCLTCESQAQITSLGPLPGGTVTALSRNGSTVVGHSSGPNGIEGFAWRIGSDRQGTGDLAGGEFRSEARGCSPDGSLVVGFGTNAAGRRRAFRFRTNNGTIQGIGALPGAGDQGSEANGTDDGTYVVGKSGSVNGTEAFLWHFLDGIQGLGDLPGGDFNSEATAVTPNRFGGAVVVGFGTNSLNRIRAFRWTESEGMQGLGALPGTGNQGSFARAVSTGGSVVVGTSEFLNSTTGVIRSEVFRWTVGGGMQSLGILPGYNECFVGGVSADDGSTVVGYCEDLQGQTEAFIWEEGFGMRPLFDVMQQRGVDLSNWTSLTTAVGVSRDGLTIAGTGVVGSQSEVFIATIDPPPPTTKPTEITSLGALPGGFANGSLTGLSADGSTIIGHQRIAGNFTDAFRWRLSNSFPQGLGDLPGGDFSSAANDLAEFGGIVVGSGVNSLGRTRAIRWASGERQGLGALPGGPPNISGNFSRANGASQFGSTVVGESSSANGIEAFRWVVGRGMQGLGDLPGGDFNSVATDVSGTGSVVIGYGTNALNRTRAFRWTQFGGMEGLGALPGTRNQGSFARAISTNGLVIVGTSEFLDSTTGVLRSEVFRWTVGGGMQSLGVLPGNNQCFVGGVSENGSVVVGHCADLQGQTEAFIWEEGVGMRPLFDVLTERGANSLSRWTSLGTANGVSDDGRIVAGVGTLQGSSNASIFVVTFNTPEPEVAALQSDVLLGDVNLDGAVDFLDVSAFISLLSTGDFQAEADVDESGAVDFLDIAPFIAILSGS